MLALLALIVSIALADAINPSTIAPALYYASTVRPRATLTGFALGVFTVQFSGGVLVLLGGRKLVASLLPDVSDRTKHAALIAGGVVMIALAAGIWLMRERVEERAARPRAVRVGSAFMLGAGIMAFELPTAFPYFAALAAIGASPHGSVAQVALVALYCALFVVPVFAILALRTLAGARGERVIRWLRDWTQRNAAAILATVLAVIGIACAVVGAAGLR